MPNHTSRLQGAQLELFRPLSDAIQGHKVPHEIQQRAVTLLARLLRDYSGIPHRPAKAKEGSHE